VARRESGPERKSSCDLFFFFSLPPSPFVFFCLFLGEKSRGPQRGLPLGLIPVSPLPADALLRLTEWFPALGQLTWHNRARLAALLDGHPRAVEYATTLVRNAIDGYRERVGQWSVSSPPTEEDIEREWCDLVEPALPRSATAWRRTCFCWPSYGTGIG